MMNRILVLYEKSQLQTPYYAAIQTETGFLFHYCYNFWKVNGVDEREFQRSVKVPGPKDFVIERAQILEKRLYVPAPRNPLRGKGIGYSGDGPGYCGYIDLRTEEKTYHFLILSNYRGNIHTEAELRRFFDVSDAEMITPAK